VVYERFGALREGVGADPASLVLDGDLTNHTGQEYATFFSGPTVFALDVEHVREARPASEITRVTIGSPARSAGVLRLNARRADEKMIWVFDLALLLGGRPSAIEGSSQVVVVEHLGRTIGLLVGELHTVSAFDVAQMSNAPLAGASQLVKGIIKANRGASLIQLLDVDCLFDLFQPPQEIPAANDAVGVAELATA
jgi:chemotaxis signal transduction protein